jgi:hypothetical protein
MGSRSVDLDKGLSSLLLSPVRARASLGFSACLASPQLLVASASARHLLGICLAPPWHLHGICFGAPLARCGPPTSSLLSGFACISQLPALVMVRLLGAPPTGAPDSANAPPTGGIHSASRTHLLRRSNCPRATAVSINVQSSI